MVLRLADVPLRAADDWPLPELVGLGLLGLLTKLQLGQELRVLLKFQVQILLG